MSKTWYPVVDTEKCIECGLCVDNCPHNVYDKTKSPVPVVVSEEKCIQGCRKCGRNCPVGAIEYIGDTNSNTNDCNTGDCCCANSYEKENKKNESSCECGKGCGCVGKC
jgi:NAD-dependent dihydropyrimidine dehydrogenase PreA subunit